MLFHSILLAALFGWAVHCLDRFVQNGDVRIHYQISGKGPLLLLLHGFPDNSNTFSEQTAVLEKSHTVVRPTLRGYPPSDILEVSEESYALTAVVEDILVILDELEVEKAFIGGHDFGGAAIQLLTLLHPERVEGLIIINSPIVPRFYDLVNFDKDQQALSAYTIPYIEYQPGDDKNIEVVIQNIQDDDYREEIRQYLIDSPMDGMFAYYKYNFPAPPYGMVVDTSAMVYQVPTLIIWGVEDEYFSLKMLDGIPTHFNETVRLVTLPGAGHWSFRDQAARVNAEILSWLSFMKKKLTCGK